MNTTASPSVALASATLNDAGLSLSMIVPTALPTAIVGVDRSSSAILGGSTSVSVKFSLASSSPSSRVATATVCVRAAPRCRRRESQRPTYRECVVVGKVVGCSRCEATTHRDFVIHLHRPRGPPADACTTNSTGCPSVALASATLNGRRIVVVEDRACRGPVRER